MVDLAAVLDALWLGLVIYDDKLNILYCNRASRHLASAARNPELLQEEIRELARQCRIQKACRTRIFDVKADNKQVTYRAKAWGLDPNYHQIIVTIEDDTSTFRLERTLLKAETLTVHGQLAIDALTEIRNPLTVALGFCELVAESDAGACPFVNYIREELLAIKDILENFAVASPARY